jgi:hypothetical protein
MKRILLLVSCTLTISTLAQNNVTLNINHKLGNEEFSFNEEAINNLGEVFEVTRLEYYVSEIIITHDGGTQTPIEETWLLVDAGEPANYDLGSYDITEVESITIHVGVDEAHNHLDPATYPADHPLAPQFPSMHWGWSAGYRFVAYEGNAGANMSQVFQLHCLEDENYFANTIALSTVADNGEILIDLDADYARGLFDISVNDGLIEHSGNWEAKDCLVNFRHRVFSEAGSEVNIPEFEELDVAIYPNPVSNGSVTVQCQNADVQNYRLFVFDLMGNRVEARRVSSSMQRIDVQQYPAGIYFIKLVAQNGSTTTHKLTVQ